MVSISGIKNSFSKLFTSKAKQQASKVAKEATKPKYTSTPTEVYRDLETNAVTRMEKIYSYPDGTKKLFRYEPSTLPDGSKQWTTSVYATSGENFHFGYNDEGLETVRTRIKKAPEKSILGGNRHTINTKYSETMGETAREETLIKDYTPNGVLAHTEATQKYRHWDRPEVATQDLVYGNKPLNQSFDKMFKEPNAQHAYKHSLDTVHGHSDNYGHFTDGKETLYSKAIKAKEEKALEETKLAQEAKEAAELASQKAKDELKAKMPRFNTSKLFGLNPEELKMVEKVHDDGSITRYFFLPETGVGRRQPVIKTYDQGLLHKEWITGTKKADSIYLKQVGDETPYIVAKKGNYTQVEGMLPDATVIDGKSIQKAQYYNDGANKLKRNYDSQQLYNAYGKVQVFDKTAQKSRADFPEIAKEFPDYQHVRIERGNSTHGQYLYNLNNKQKEANKKMSELNIDAKNNLINLQDLLNDYKA